MSDVDADQVSDTVGASQPGGVVEASQVGGTVGARLAQPQASLWTPAQLGNDLALWLDVWDSEFNLRTDGGTDYVERWGDLSGNGNDAVQTTGSQQPLKNTNSIQTDGEDDFLSTTFKSSILPPHTIFSLWTIEDDEGTLYDGINRFNHYYLINGAGNGLRLYSGQSIQGSENVSLGAYLTSTHVDTTSEIYNNGSLYTSGDTKTSTLVGLNVGVRHWEDDFFFDGKIRVIVVLNTNPSDSERQNIEGWLAHKAYRNGIPEPLDNLPSDHPFKDEPPRV